MSVEQLEELFLATGWGPLLVKLAREDAEREGRTECLLALLRVRFGEDPVLEEVAQRFALWVDSLAAVMAIESATSPESLMDVEPPE